MNIELLKQIKQQILKFPGQFNMRNYFCHEDSMGDGATGCGTAACIAGWAVYLHGKKKKEKLTLEDVTISSDSVHEKATKILGIDNTDLFYDDRWPIIFESAYHQAETNKEAAKVAAKVIDDFIKTKEWGKEAE